MRLATIVLIAVFGLMGCGWQTGSGEKVGTIIQLSYDGAFHKTYEAEVIRGGMNGGGGSFSVTPVWVTLTTPDQVTFAQQALDNQREVDIHYVQIMAAPISSDKENKFCTDIKYSTH